MPASYVLKVVTPERTLVNDHNVIMIIVRSTEGEIGVMAHHIHLVTPLVPHIISIQHADDNRSYLSIGGGFLEVTEGQVVILADSAERPSEIDVARAERARQRALENIGQAAPNMDLIRAKRALARAETRLRLASQHQGNSATISARQD